MIDLTREHKIIKGTSFCLLYPVPVIEGKKYLIEVQTPELAELLQWALSTNLVLSPDDAFVKERIHTDTVTPVLVPQLEKLRFQVFNQRVPLNLHIDKIESALSRALIDWALNNSDEGAANLEKVRKLWVAQKNCKTCKSLGILESKFYASPPPPLIQPIAK